MSEAETKEPKLLELVPEDNEILKQTMEEFVFDGNVDPWELVQNMVHTMIENKGVGLSANQVGLPYRMFVVYGNPPLAMFNPRIVDVSEADVYLDEGCLSYPGLYVKVKRPQHIKVRYANADGETVTEKFTGMTARVIQHELDHLNGIRFFDRATRYHREQGFKKRAK